MATPILAASAAFDPSKRTILPLAAAVRAPRFRRRDWDLSQTAREILDSFDGPPPPQRAARSDTTSELSIILEGTTVEQRTRVGGHEVRQRYTTNIMDAEQALQILEPTSAYSREPSLGVLAGEALARMQSRKPRVVSAPPTGRGWTVIAWVCGLVALSAGVGAVLSLVRP